MNDINNEWLKTTYLAETGREIDLASNQLHETTNWSIGVVVATISAIAVAEDAYPTRWTLAAVVVCWILLVRFFVRSCIAYSYLDRRSKIHRMIVELQLCAVDQSRRTALENVNRAICLYDVNWKSATRIGRLIKSNLLLGYLQLFVVTMSLLVYGFARSPWTDWMTWVLGSLLSLDLVWESCQFPHKTYLKYEPVKHE